MARRRPERPRDPNQLGRLIVGLSVGQEVERAPEPENPATEFARKGGLKGGNARAATLSPEKRRAIAREAAKKRWGKEGD
jgi:hypothetical protein